MQKSTWVLVAVIAVAACKDTTQPLYPGGAPEDVREACVFTQAKCTACHDQERIVAARMTPTEWRNTVERMRRYPGSAISPTDIDIVLRCLTYHSSAVLPSSPDLLACRTR